MTDNIRIAFAQVELLAATPEQSPVLANLLELYAHDFSAFQLLEIGDDGRFGYPRLPLYWSDPGRHPLLVRVAGKPAGFALIKQGSEISADTAVWDMAEFFVLRGYRGRGLGTYIAHEVWRRFPGPWEVRVLHAHASAHRFWNRAVADFTGEPIHPLSIEKNGMRWDVFSFTSFQTPSP